MDIMTSAIQVQFHDSKNKHVHQNNFLNGVDAKTFLIKEDIGHRNKLNALSVVFASSQLICTV